METTQKTLSLQPELIKELDKLKLKLVDVLGYDLKGIDSAGDLRITLGNVVRYNLWGAKTTKIKKLIGKYYPNSVGTFNRLQGAAEFFGSVMEDVVAIQDSEIETQSYSEDIFFKYFLKSKYSDMDAQYLADQAFDMADALSDFYVEVLIQYLVFKITNKIEEIEKVLKSA